MTIQLNTDKNISGNEKLESYLYSLITEDLTRFSSHITRIEIHLSDDNGSKKGLNDKRCMLEARVENRQPIAVTNHSSTIEDAVNGALDKLKKSLETILGRLQNH